MASVFRKKGTWYVRFKDWTGAFKKQVTRALTKTEAQRLADDLERRAERQRLGMEELPSESKTKLTELCEWWLKNRCNPRREHLERARLKRYVLNGPLGKLQVRQVTPEVVEDTLRQMERDELSPSTINGLRSLLRTIYTTARKAPEPYRFRGMNPILDVQSWAVPKKVQETLRAEEVNVLLPYVPDYWLGVFVTALYTGMRKGEIFGLRKRDVDLNANLIVVSRSYDQETTKGKHADAIPIAPPLKPFLEAAMAASPSELVFPDPEGKMRLKEADPEKVLRRAMGRAGLVEGYEFVCRRCKARRQEPHTWRFPDCEERFCPTCEMRLWPKAIPRQMKFHSLRHTVATLLLRAKVPMQHVQRILRHTDIKLTVDTYGHLVVEDLHDSVGTLPQLEILPSTASHAAPPATPRFVPLMSPAFGAGKDETPGALDFSKDSGGFYWSGRQDLNLRPLGPEPSALPG